MLIIVFYHSILFWRGNWFTAMHTEPVPILSLVADWLNNFHIYGFTLISGYIFYYVKNERNGYEQFLSFATTKIKRLIIPYIFISVCWVIPIDYAFFKCTAVSYIKRFAFGTSPSQLWFLLMLFNVFIIFFVFNKLFVNRNIKGLLLVILLYGCGLIFQKILPDLFQIFRSMQYVTYFYIGFKIRQYGSKLIMRIPAVCWLIFYTVIFGIAKYIDAVENAGIFYQLLNKAISILLTTVGAVMIFVVLQKISQRFDYSKNKFFNILIRLSMPIYLIHQQIIYVLLYWLNGLMSPYILCFIVFAVALLISTLISVFLMRFSTTRKLIGEKTLK